MKFQQVSAINSSPATASKIAREQASIDAGLVYKANETPKGAVMFCYTVAVLGWLGAFKGAAFKSAALAGMFGSPTVVSHHKKAGNLEACGAGMVRLTIKGDAHFGGRELGKVSGQAVDSKDVRCVGLAIKAGPTVKAAQESAIVRQITWRKVGSVK